jgi:mycothiol system anti-sigma-R factor
MMTCEKVLEGLWEYLDRELDKDGQLDVQKHLDLCRSCFSRMEFEKLLREQMRLKTNHICPDKLRKKIHDIIELY